MNKIKLKKILSKEQLLTVSPTWRPNVGEDYYSFVNLFYCNHHISIDKRVWFNSYFHELRYEYGLCFKTKKEAEDILYDSNIDIDFFIKLIDKLYRGKNLLPLNYKENEDEVYRVYSEMACNNGEEEK